MPSQRQQRVSREILQAVSTIVEHHVKDPQLGLVAFTEAKVSPDLRNATVYFSVLGDETARKQSEAALGRASGFIRRELGRNVALRYTPTLRFVFDEAPGRAQRIEELLARGKTEPGEG